MPKWTTYAAQAQVQHQRANRPLVVAADQPCRSRNNINPAAIVYHDSANRTVPRVSRSPSNSPCPAPNQAITAAKEIGPNNSSGTFTSRVDCWRGIVPIMAPVGVTVNGLRNSEEKKKTDRPEMSENTRKSEERHDALTSHPGSDFNRFPFA